MKTGTFYIKLAADYRNRPYMTIFKVLDRPKKPMALPGDSRTIGWQLASVNVRIPHPEGWYVSYYCIGDLNIDPNRIAHNVHSVLPFNEYNRRFVEYVVANGRFDLVVRTHYGHLTPDELADNLGRREREVHRKRISMLIA